MRRILWLFLAVLALVVTNPAHAVVSSVSSEISYTAGGSTLTFVYPFKVHATSEVEVWLNSVKSTTGRTVSMNANQDTTPGGSVVFVSAPGAGTVVKIKRVAVLNQPVVYTPYSAFPAKTTEKALDHAMMAVQQVDQRVAAAELKEEADKLYLEGVIASLNGQSHSVTSASAVLPTGALNTRTLGAMASDTKNVLNYGTDNTGAADAAPGIEAAIAAVPSTGGVVLIPPGVYRLATPIDLIGRSNITIQGIGAEFRPDTDVRFIFMDTVENIRITGLLVKGTMETIDPLVLNTSQGTGWSVNAKRLTWDHNVWEGCGGAPVFLSINNTGVIITNNHFLRNNASIQATGSLSGVVTDVTVSNNYFLGSLGGTAPVGSDDFVAFFGGLGNGNITITGNVFDKQGPSAKNQAHAIYIGTSNHPTDSLSNITIANNVIKNSRSTSRSAGSITVGAYGTSTGFGRVVITGNTIYNCNEGIMVQGPVSELVISSNTIRDIYDNGVYAGNSYPQGIRVECGVSPCVKNVVISSNILSNIGIGGSTGFSGIDLSGVDTVSVIGNQVHNATLHGISAQGATNTRFTFIGNHVMNNAVDGIRLSNTTRSILIGNSLSANNGYGLRFSGASVSAFVAGNNLDGNTSGSLYNIGASSNIRWLENPDTGTFGLSGTSTAARNLRGQVTVTDGSTTGTVNFTNAPEIDANYFIVLTPVSAVGVPDPASRQVFSVAKSTTGFTVTVRAAPGGTTSVTFDWVLIR